MADFRICKVCGEAKLLTTEFWYAQRGYRDGFRPQCKVCVNAKLTEYKRESRRKRGAVPKRQPRIIDGVEVKRWRQGIKPKVLPAQRFDTDGVELRLCLDPECERGWQRISDFYGNTRGGVRRRCKACSARRASERNRNPKKPRSAAAR